MRKKILLLVCLSLFLVSCTGINDKEIALEQFEKLQAALSDRGIDIYLDNIYHSPEYRTGLAVDIGVDLGDVSEIDLEADMLKEVHNVMPEFGFIPCDSHGPTHIRFVGIEKAKALKEK